MLLGKSRYRAITNSSIKNEATGPKQKGYPVCMFLEVKVNSDAVKKILHMNMECEINESK